MQKDILEFRTLITDSDRIVFLTGAGMSTESGIPDFRSAGGVWESDRELMNSMSSWYLEGRPKDFWRSRRKLAPFHATIRVAEPNAGHRAIAELERTHDVKVFTQNIDGLHQKAGSTFVREMHGNARYLVCPKCKIFYEESEATETIPRCTAKRQGGKCDWILHPDTVLFGQEVRHYKAAKNAIREADLLVVLGTSLVVEPVASLPKLARGKLVIVNRTETQHDGKAKLVIRGSIGDTLQAIVSK